MDWNSESEAPDGSRCADVHLWEHEGRQRRREPREVGSCTTHSTYDYHITVQQWIMRIDHSATSLMPGGKQKHKPSCAKCRKRLV